MSLKFSLEALLGLYSIPTIGPSRMRKLISILRSPEAVFDASIRQLRDIEGIDNKTAVRIKKGPNEDFIRNQLKLMKEIDAGILTYWDEDYPSRLKKIYDPPAFLFYKGRTEALTKPSIGIVGTRVPSSYGRLVTERFTGELVDNNFTIISGFARGVDTIAHITSVKQKGITIAVLGNGIDVIYPAENKKLFNQIIENGIIITEYPMGTKPDAGNFPKRNRIISGISVGILIPEAGARSGALITALYAVDQDREVFAVPGPITSGKSAGVNKLIKEGAKLVQGVDDILCELNRQLDLKFHKKSIQTEEPDLNGNNKVIYDLLNDEPVHVDQLAIQADISPAETLSALLTLELMGLIRQMAGKMFVKL
ncbi:MAG: DNA-processing protein DprA [Calditrichaceae bacterium]|jgi:DNA processing protein